MPEMSGARDLVKCGRGFVFVIGFGMLARIINRPLKTFVETKEKRVRIKMEHMESIDDFFIISKIRETPTC